MGKGSVGWGKAVLDGESAELCESGGAAEGGRLGKRRAGGGTLGGGVGGWVTHGAHCTGCDLNFAKLRYVTSLNYNSLFFPVTSQVCNHPELFEQQSERLPCYFAQVHPIHTPHPPPPSGRKQLISITGRNSHLQVVLPKLLYREGLVGLSSYTLGGHLETWKPKVLGHMLNPFAAENVHWSLGQKASGGSSSSGTRGISREGDEGGRVYGWWNEQWWGFQSGFSFSRFINLSPGEVEGLAAADPVQRWGIGAAGGVVWGLARQQQQDLARMWEGFWEAGEGQQQEEEEELGEHVGIGGSSSSNSSSSRHVAEAVARSRRTARLLLIVDDVCCSSRTSSSSGGIVTAAAGGGGGSMQLPWQGLLGGGGTSSGIAAAATAAAGGAGGGDDNDWWGFSSSSSLLIPRLVRRLNDSNNNSSNLASITSGAGGTGVPIMLGPGGSAAGAGLGLDCQAGTQVQQQQAPAAAGHTAEGQELTTGGGDSSSEFLVSEPLICSSQSRLDAARNLLRCCWGAVFPVLSPPPLLVCSDRGAMNQMEDMEGDAW